MAPKTTNRGVAWLQSEVKALLDIWADQEIQEQLAGRLHNMCIYEKISRRLKDLGFNRTGEQCREKIKKLRRDYKTVVHNNYSPAYARRLLGFYDKVHKIFGKPLDGDQLRDTETSSSSKCSENKHADFSNLPQSDTEMELSAESFTTIINTDIDFSGMNETASIDSDRNSMKAAGNYNDDLATENENMFENIYQNYTLFTKTLKHRQDTLNDKFTELAKTENTDKLQTIKDGLSFLECERQKTKSHELKMFKTLLQLLANKKGFETEFNATSLSLTRININK